MSAWNDYLTIPRLVEILWDRERDVFLHDIDDSVMAMTAEGEAARRLRVTCKIPNDEAGKDQKSEHYGPGRHA